MHDTYTADPSTAYRPVNMQPTGSMSRLAVQVVKMDAPKSLSMAVIPMGTADDFATGTGLPEDPWEALQLCTMDTAQPIDVGLVKDNVRFQ